MVTRHVNELVLHIIMLRVDLKVICEHGIVFNGRNLLVHQQQNIKLEAFYNKKKCTLAAVRLFALKFQFFSENSKRNFCISHVDIQKFRFEFLEEKNIMEIRTKNEIIDSMTRLIVWNMQKNNIQHVYIFLIHKMFRNCGQRLSTKCTNSINLLEYFCGTQMTHSLGECKLI